MRNRPLVTGSIGFVAINCVVTVALLSGCVTPPSPPPTVLASDACAPNTPGARYTLGAQFMRADVVGHGQDQATRVRLGLIGNALLVREVTPSMPASRAGLVVGDRVVRVNGFLVPDAIDANAQVARHIDAALRQGLAIKFDVVRRFVTSSGGASVIQQLDHTVVITPQRVCADLK